LKHIFSLVLLIGLFLFIQVSSAQDTPQCSPHIDVISDLLTQAQAKFDSKDVQAGLNILAQAQKQLDLETASCLNYAPDTAGDKRSNPVKYGDWKSVKTDSEVPASVQIVDFVDNADAKATGNTAQSGKKFITFRVNMRCEASPDDYCTLGDYTDMSIVGGRGIPYPKGYFNIKQNKGVPTQIYGTGELSYLYAFEVDASDTNFEIQLQPMIGLDFWFATQ
jgi:hypothetical protein